MAHEFIEINDVSVNYEINNLLAVSGLDMKIKSGSFFSCCWPFRVRKIYINENFIRFDKTNNWKCKN